MDSRYFLILCGAVQANHMQSDLKKLRLNFLWEFFIMMYFACHFTSLKSEWQKVTKPTQMTQLLFTRFPFCCEHGYQTVLGDRVLLSPASSIAFSAQLLGSLFYKYEAVILSKLSWDTDLCCLCSKAYFSLETQQQGYRSEPRASRMIERSRNISLAYGLKYSTLRLLIYSFCSSSTMEIKKNNLNVQLKGNEPEAIKTPLTFSHTV